MVDITPAPAAPFRRLCNPGRPGEACRFAYLTLAFFSLHFGGLAGVLVLAHYLTAAVN